MKMKPVTTWGLLCNKKDEKTIVASINNYLATVDRTMSRATSASMLQARLPHAIKHFYWNLNKSTGTWFELFPNEDLNGRFYNEHRKDCAWLITARIDTAHPAYEKQRTEEFLNAVLSAAGVRAEVLEEAG